MIESILALFAVFGCGIGEVGDPDKVSLNDNANHEMFRAIDTQELKGFENLEVQNAEEWFV